MFVFLLVRILGPSKAADVGGLERCEVLGIETYCQKSYSEFLVVLYLEPYRLNTAGVEVGCEDQLGLILAQHNSADPHVVILLGNGAIPERYLVE